MMKQKKTHGQAGKAGGEHGHLFTHTSVGAEGGRGSHILTGTLGSGGEKGFV